MRYWGGTARGASVARVDRLMGIYAKEKARAKGNIMYFLITASQEASTVNDS